MKHHLKTQRAYRRKLPVVLILGLIFIALFLTVSGVYYLKNFQEQNIQQTSNVLFTITNIKAEHVKDWKEERLKEALLMQNNIRLTNNAFRLIDEPSNEQVLSRLEGEYMSFTQFHPYEFFILDPTGKQLHAWPGQPQDLQSSVFIQHLDVRDGNIQFVDFYQGKAPNEFFLGMVVPLGITRENGPLFLIARINPVHGLFPYFEASLDYPAEVESFFLFNTGSELVALSNHSSFPDDSTLVKLEESDSQDLFTMLLNDNTRMQRGKGIGGEKAIGTMAEINGTNWLVLVEMKEKMLIYTFRQKILFIFILGSVFLLCVIGLVMLMVRQHEIRLLKYSRENEILLDDLVNNQPYGIYRFALKTHQRTSAKNKPDLPQNEFPLDIIYVNKQFEAITGLLAKEFHDNPKRFIDIVHPDDRKVFFRTIVGALKKMTSFTWEGRVVTNDLLRWVRFEAVPRNNEHKGFTWTGVAMDISLQKKMESDILHRKAFEHLITELSSLFLNVSFANCDQILETALARLGAFSKTDRAYIFLLNDRESIASNTHEWCAEGIEYHKANLQRMAYSDIPQWMRQLKEISPINLYDTEHLPEIWSNESKLLVSQGIKSVAAVPVISGDNLYGFVGFDSVREHRQWKDYEIQLLRVFSDLVYNALEKSKAEQMLVESQQMLRTVLDSLVVRVFWKDTALQYRGCNKAFAHDAGLRNPEDIIGMSDFDLLWNGLAEKYQEEDRLIMDSCRPVLNQEEFYKNTHGDTKWMRVSRLPLTNATGNVIGVLGTYHDITEQKTAADALIKSEKKYRILTESAFDGIYLLRNDSLEYVNHRFCEITGYSFDELTSDHFNILTLFTAQSKELAQQRKQARREEKDIPNTYEMQIITRSGEVKDMEISTNKLEGTGHDHLILGIMRDICERKNNELLRNEVTIANQSAVFKQNFLANMSHEIRTPLTGVLGMIEILATTQLDPVQLDYISTLRLSTENLREIINQILDYSKIEAGETHLKTMVFETAALFDNARKLYQASCEKDVQLTIDVHPAIPQFIEADEQRLSQVINNLLSNAIKFTEKGHISIRARVEDCPDDQQVMIKILVEDTGIGICEKAMLRLFKPFGQVDNEDKRQFDGTGLGLSISKELVKLMQGDMGVSSSPGKGSTFWFTFMASRSFLPSPNEPLQSYSQKPLVGLNILFAEDKIINQKVVSLMLTSMGHKVTIANNGQEVLDVFVPETFDLILMDIQMPVMDGITATTKLKETYDVLPPIVGLSANAFEGDREKYMAQGLDEYLTKPVNSFELNMMINQLQLNMPQV